MHENIHGFMEILDKTLSSTPLWGFTLQLHLRSPVIEKIVQELGLLITYNIPRLHSIRHIWASSEFTSQEPLMRV